MRRALVVVILISVTVAQSAAADTAPALLKEAVRSGTADAEVFAAIADWVLYEKEEKVAAGLAEVLDAVSPTLGGGDGARWDAPTRAMLGLFTGVLRDAQMHRRVDPAEAEARLSAVAGAAAPAVAEALREAGLNACLVDAAAKAVKKIEGKQP